MLFEYDKQKWSRGEAWRDCLRTRPDFIINDGFLFRIPENGFRKHHDGERWAWYAAKWVWVSVWVGNQILREAPCEPPELDPKLDPTMVGKGYVWAVWTEYDGEQRCGFVLPHLVPRPETLCGRCKGVGEIVDPWDSLPMTPISCPDCKGEGEL